MNRREAGLLFALAPLALAAALLHRPATRPAGIHDPAYSASYRAAVDLLPLLDAVRVRSDDRHAPHRIRTNRGFWIEEVLDPGPARELFTYGRLLFLDEAGLREVRDTLDRGELPPLPPAPAIDAWYRDANGPFLCDVVLSDDAGIGRILETVPDARLWGEPVARRDDARSGGAITSALLAVLAAGALFNLVKPAVLQRLAIPPLEVRLGSALVPLVVLGVLGWGVGAETVAAVALVLLAPRGAPLWVGGACLLFPPLALKRIGLVLLAGAVARARLPRRPRDVDWRRRLVAWGVLVVGGVILLIAHEPRGLAPEVVRTGQAVRFGGPARPPAWLPEPVTEPGRRALLNGIYQRADRLARGRTGEQAERFEEVAKAAAVESLHLPRGITARLETTDGREVIWSDREPDLGDEAWMSAELYRRRGDRALRRDAGWAALLILLLFGLTSCGRARRDAGVVGLALLGGAVLVAAEAWGAPLSAEAWMPIAALTSVLCAAPPSRDPR